MSAGGVGRAPVLYEWHAPGWLLPVLWWVSVAVVAGVSFWLGRRSR